MIRTLTPDLDLEDNCLQNIIVIDEAHQILEKVKNSVIRDYDNISKEQLEKIFDTLLREFGGKGVSFIIADQTPSDLFNCVTKLPSLKILFRLEDDCIKRFLSNIKEQEFLSRLKNRQALVIDGDGNRYAIETLDYNVKKNEE